MLNVIKFLLVEVEIELGLNIKDGLLEFVVCDYGSGVLDEFEGKMF